MSKVPGFCDDVLGDESVSLLKEAQDYTLTSLQEARSMLEKFNFENQEKHLKIKDQLEKKVAVLDQMRSDLVHIYSQLNVIESKISNLEENSAKTS